MATEPSDAAFVYRCPDCGAVQPEPGRCGRCPGVVQSLHKRTAAPVLESLGRLQDRVAGTPYEVLVDDLVAALAADTTVADLRQEIAFREAGEQQDPVRPVSTEVATEVEALGGSGLDSSAADSRGVVTFLEYGTHKTIQGAIGTTMMSGSLRVSDQATIDALHEAFEKAGWTVTDRAC